MATGKVGLTTRTAASGRDDGRRAARRRWLRWALVTTALMLVASAATSGFVAGRYEARLGLMARQMSALSERFRRDEAALRGRMSLYADLVDLLRDPATRVVAMRGSGPSPRASGRVIWQEAGGGHVFVAGLPPAPADRTYAVWTIARGRPRAAGTLDVDAAGRASQRVAPAEGGPVEVFAVTVEPAGGVSKPTGPVVLTSR